MYAMVPTMAPCTRLAPATPAGGADVRTRAGGAMVAPAPIIVPSMIVAALMVAASPIIVTPSAPAAGAMVTSSVCPPAMAATDVAPPRTGTLDAATAGGIVGGAADRAMPKS